MANPPFNLKGWYDENLKNDARWADYVTPPESNANYAWILHILSHLKPSDGVAGFLLANGALNDSDTLEIRKRLIQNDKVEAIVVLPRELFITTDISVPSANVASSKNAALIFSSSGSRSCSIRVLRSASIPSSYFSPINLKNTSVSIISLFSKKEPELRAARK